MTDTRQRGAVAPLAVALALALAGLSGCGLIGGHRRDRIDASASAGVTLAVGTSRYTITVDGRERTFQVYRPGNLAGTDPVPLVVMLHGALGTGQQAESSYGWDDEADQEGFLVAYPDGLSRSWAVSDGCCGPSVRDGVNEVAFIEQMVSTVNGMRAVDPDRVYATGISNGGMLAYRLACDSTLFAAIGPDSTTMLGDCPSPARISVIHIHGTDDETIPYGGGPGRRDNDGTGRSPVRIDGPPVPELAERWRKIADCTEPTRHTSGKVTTESAQCPQGRAVELITIAGAGHQWPGAPGPNEAAERLLNLDPPFAGLDATATIWAFFREHPRAAG